MPLKKTLNAVRRNLFISNILRVTLTPIEKFCKFLSVQIRKKIWVNGRVCFYDGTPISFPVDVGVSYNSSIYWNGLNGFEPNTWFIIKSLLIKCDVFLDIGSNIGLYTILAKKRNKNVIVYSFEPVPSIFHKNILFHKKNNVSPNNVFNIALSNNKGESNIYLPVNLSSSEEETTATLRRDSWQFSHNHICHKVRTEKLDSFFDDNKITGRILIKIDVEDFESSVLRGGESMIEKLRPIFICEILPRDHGNVDTVFFLEKIKYVAYGITSSGLFRFQRNDFLKLRSFTDFLLVHESLFQSQGYLDISTLGNFEWRVM